MCAEVLARTRFADDHLGASEWPARSSLGSAPLTLGSSRFRSGSTDFPRQSKRATLVPSGRATREV